MLIGIALVATGLAFKISLAPFHQWTPDVYQGAPTPITAFMAVATKAAAFVALVRLFEVALGPVVDDWQPALAVLAVDLDRGREHRRARPGLAEAADGLLGRRAGRLHAGRRRGGDSSTGINALVFYLAAYTLMNLAVFAVIVVRERETAHGDDIESVAGLGRDQPDARLAADDLDAGARRPPGTSGFMGKLYLIEAAVDGDYTWLGVMIVIGSMISLAYYLRVIAAIWMRPGPAAAPVDAMPAIAGGSPEADAAAPDCAPGPGCVAGGRGRTRLRHGDGGLRDRSLAADRLGLARGLVARDDALTRHR